MVSINTSPFAEFFHVGQYKQIELSNTCMLHRGMLRSFAVW